MNALTELKEGLSIGWSAIRANKLRSVLTTLGIVIGIVTVTLMGTAIEGLNSAFLHSISFIGADVLDVQRHEGGPHPGCQHPGLDRSPAVHRRWLHCPRPIYFVGRGPRRPISLRHRFRGGD